MFFKLEKRARVNLRLKRNPTTSWPQGPQWPSDSLFTSCQCGSSERTLLHSKLFLRGYSKVQLDPALVPDLVTGFCLRD